MERIGLLHHKAELDRFVNTQRVDTLINRPLCDPFSASQAVSSLLGFADPAAAMDVLEQFDSPTTVFCDDSDDSDRFRNGNSSQLNALSMRYQRGIRKGLEAWQPGRVGDTLSRVRNLINLSALFDCSCQPERAVVSYLIYEKLMRDLPWNELTVALTTVVLQAQDMPVMTGDQRLGFMFPLPERDVRKGCIRSAQRLLHGMLPASQCPRCAPPSLFADADERWKALVSAPASDLAQRHVRLFDEGPGTYQAQARQEPVRRLTV